MNLTAITKRGATNIKAEKKIYENNKAKDGNSFYAKFLRYQREK
jgi:hypothetical protein